MKKFLNAKNLAVATISILAFVALSYFAFFHTSAATSGKMTLYFHKEASDINETYNSMSLTPPEPATDSAPTTTTSTTNVNATPPTSFCESADSQSESYNERIASAASTGNRCLGTFISMPVGNAISMSTSDTNAITSQLWSIESATQATVALNVYLYRWNGSGTTVASTDRIATLTCADPGSSATSCTVTATPANNITFAATDRIVAIVSANVTALRSGATTAFLFDSSARTAASVTLKYTVLSYNNTNKPTLSGSLDDDFTTAAATTSCTTGGVSYNTKWTCLQGSAANTAGAFNAEDTAASGSGDSSSWLWLRNQETTATATVSNFGTTPSNTFLYQSLTPAYGNGNIRTVVNETHTFGVDPNHIGGSSPYNHSGLVLWASNTDYLELEVYSNSNTGDPSSGGFTNTVFVALNNSGTLSGDTSLNTTNTSGIYNEVWLGFVNTNGSWQAQYSTDGSTWNNIGTAVSHGAFSRAGLNVFNAAPSDISTYGAAFEWFQSTLASPTYTQTSYAWFNDNDAVAPGTVLAGNNTPAMIPTAGGSVRLRMLVKLGGQAPVGGLSFYMQMVDPGGGTCASPSGTGSPASWTNQTLSTILNFPNYFTLVIGSNINAATGDPTDSPNTVIPENFNASGNPTSNNQTALNNNQEGLWDFGVKDNGAPQGHTYCFRLIQGDNVTPLNSYVNYPMITTYQPGPTMDQVMRGGMWFSSGTKQGYFWAQ